MPEASIDMPGIMVEPQPESYIGAQGGAHGSHSSSSVPQAPTGRSPASADSYSRQN